MPSAERGAATTPRPASTPSSTKPRRSGAARNSRSDNEDSGVEVLLDDYHNRLVLFLMKTLGSYFARRLHSHQGLRSFSSKAYPA